MNAGPHVQSIFLAHGTDDKTCSYDAAMKWMEHQTNVKDRVTKSYEGAYHQLHADLCKEEFATDLVKYILERSSPAGEAPIEAKL